MYIERRFFTNGRGDTIIALLIILLVTFMVPRQLGLIWLSRLAGQGLAYAIIPYFALHYTVKSLLKYNQLLVYSLTYVVTFLLLVLVSIY